MSLPDNYAGLSPLYCGRVAPSVVTPAWLAGQPLNTLFQIANTAGAGGSPVDAFSGICIRQAHSKIYIALAGGHSQGLDNRVVECDLRADAPAWNTLKAASTSTQIDIDYYPDGTPDSRHTYDSLMWCETRNRLMALGNYGGYVNAYSFRNLDGFNPDSTPPAWDAAGTYPDSPSSLGWYTSGFDNNGTPWWFGTDGIVAKWNPTTNTFTSYSVSYPSAGRFPYACDSLRGKMFNLQAGDGQTTNPSTMSASVFDINTHAVANITFNASAGLTALTADYNQMVDAGMDYDPVNDFFLYYAARTSSTNIYKITPNNTTVWDVSIFASNAPGGPTGGAGLNGRLKYVTAFKGFVMLPQQSSNIYFIRTA